MQGKFVEAFNHDEFIILVSIKKQFNQQVKIDVNNNMELVSLL